MDAAPLTRMRWRLRGAWLWPSFVVLTLADATVIHSLPLSGDSESWISGLLLGAVLSLIAIVLLGNLLGRMVRRMRPDMPRVVARNYAGALITLAVTLALLAGGLVHQHVVASDTFALEDATAQAEAYIGAHAPPAFQHDLRHLNTDPGGRGTEHLPHLCLRPGGRPLLLRRRQSRSAVRPQRPLLGRGAQLAPLRGDELAPRVRLAPPARLPACLARGFLCLLARLTGRLACLLMGLAGGFTCLLVRLAAASWAC